MDRAIVAYHRLLDRGSLADDSTTALREGQRERRLFFGERPLSISLRPRFLTPARYAAAAAASEAMYRALGTLEKALLRDAELRRELDLEAEEERLALADPGCRDSSPSSRLDGFFADRLRYVEYNAESPAGMAYGDNLAEVFDSLPVMREFRKRWRVRAVATRKRQLATMLRCFREWGRAEKPTIAIADWTGLPTAPEFEMFRDFFESNDVHTMICDPRELEYARGALWLRGARVTIVYRRVLTSELLMKGRETLALRDAYVDGAVCVVNTFRAKLLHKKMSFALLSDPAYARLYSAEERRAIAGHIPWTRKLTPRLADEAIRKRETLVLKPNDEYGGKGVVLGWTAPQSEWERAIASALASSYVIQEAVPVPKETYPMLLDGLTSVDLSLDLDPYLFGGKVFGALTRLSSAALLNVTAGAGSVVPTYIVEPRG
ncbi:MAG: hypothetical protein AUH85_12590 [Chloroflexi bacterium 13_1_40CM_4_68_4]|nr:MAG: hypothetical protein AUH85_12590 [Chloroflexi bacterium 13_1_40CM_4_68_4]